MSCPSFRFAPRLAAVLIFALPVAAAQAQTCGLPLPIEISDPSVPFVHSGDTCTSGNAVPSLDGIGLPHPDNLYQFRTGAGGSISASITASSFPVVMLLARGDPTTVSVWSTLVDVGDATVPITNGPLARGLYTLIVTADPGYPTTQCGTYTLEVSGTLTAFMSGC